MKMQMSIGKKKSLLWSNSNPMGLEYTKPKPVFDRNQLRNRFLTETNTETDTEALF